MPTDSTNVPSGTFLAHWMAAMAPNQLALRREEAIRLLGSSRDSEKYLPDDIRGADEPSEADTADIREPQSLVAHEPGGPNGR